MIHGQHTNINPSSKLSELIGSDAVMVRFIYRLGISFGFGDATVASVCRRYGISEKLFIQLYKMHADSRYRPDASDMDTGDFIAVLDFLSRSHDNYMHKLFPPLHANVHEMMDRCAPETSAVVNRFFDEYVEEMDRHCRYEEEVQFPYLRALSEGRRVDGVSVNEFRKQHSEVEEKLDDFRNIVMKYLPESCDGNSRFYALLELCDITEDLRCHMLLEEYVLFPLAERLEKGI